MEAMHQINERSRRRKKIGGRERGGNGRKEGRKTEKKEKRMRRKA
jgi:hypothetical protein